MRHQVLAAQKTLTGANLAAGTRSKTTATVGAAWGELVGRGVDVKDQLIECPLEMGANGTFEYHRSWSSKMKDSEDRWYHLDLPPHPGLQLQIKG